MKKLFYDVKDIMEIFDISRSGAYNFLNYNYKIGSLKVVKIGKLLRIPKSELDSWLGWDKGDDEDE